MFFQRAHRALQLCAHTLLILASNRGRSRQGNDGLSLTDVETERERSGRHTRSDQEQGRRD